MGSVNKYYSLYFIVILVFLVVILMTIANFTENPQIPKVSKDNNLNKRKKEHQKENFQNSTFSNSLTPLINPSILSIPSIPSTVSIESKYVQKLPNNYLNTENINKAIIDREYNEKSFYCANKKSPQFVSPLSSMDRLNNEEYKTQSIPRNILQRTVSFDNEKNNTITPSTAISEITLGSDTPFLDKKYPAYGYKFLEKNRKFGSNSERITCKIFEEFLGREVIVCGRPNFLKNPKTGRNLELDMYDPITKIAIEYNGEGHYNFVSKFHSDESKVFDQKERDILKRHLCEENGIILLTVPYTIDSAIPDGKGKYKYIARSEREKEQKIKNFLIPLLEETLRLRNM